MDSMFERLHAAIPGAVFRPGATDEQIVCAQELLGTQFPAWLCDLYACCNGIFSREFGEPYLYALEADEDAHESIVDWNLFVRAEWLRNLAELKQNRPEIDWDSFDPQRLIVIGSINAVDWAIDPHGGPQIIEYNVRCPDSWDIIGDDLVDACRKEEEQSREITEDLFRGRKLHSAHPSRSPAARDIDHVYNIIVQMYALDWRSHDGQNASTGWYVHEATSQRPGEAGRLFIMELSHSSGEVRIASRDGDLPFILRLKCWSIKEELTCIVGSTKDAVMRIVGAADAIRLPMVAGSDERPVPDEQELRRIWRDTRQPDMVLAEMAEVLCARDDKRRSEENELCNKMPP